jgi:antitoxin VapB
MALNIKSAEADRLARELAALTGESLTEAVTKALHARVEKHRRDDGRAGEARRQALKEELRLIRKRAASYPILDPRSDDELLGYNEIGTFD